MLLKDLTREQVIEILHLVFPHKEKIKSIDSVSYLDTETYNIPSQYKITFQSTIYDNSNRSYHTELYIYENLELDLSRLMGSLDGEFVQLPLRNLYDVYKKFRKWNIYPSVVEGRDDIIEELTK